MTVDLIQLKAELAAAGVPVNALGTDGDTIHTYDETGAIVDLPPAAAAVIAAHQPPAPPDSPDFGGDAQNEREFATVAAQAVTNLRGYLALGSPTPAQTVGIVKLLCRISLFFIRRHLR